MNQINNPSVISISSNEIHNLQYYGSMFGVTTTIDILFEIAKALAYHPNWTINDRSIIVVSPTKPPSINFIGSFDPATQWRIQSLPDRLNEILIKTRYINYPLIEEYCEILVTKLIKRFGNDELKSYSYTAIPRGGLIILGMVSYLLGLPHERLQTSNRNSSTLVIVDDCAITGGRFGSFIKQFGDRKLIFAHLFSNHKLRENVMLREPQVKDCINACELNDYGHELLGKDYSSQKQRWLTRAENPDFYYWFGYTEHICFPWGEPEISVWNPINKRIEHGWYIVPPEFSLKARDMNKKPKIELQLQQEGKGELLPAENVVFGEINGKIILTNVHTGVCFQFDDVASDMWKAIVSQENDAQSVELMLNDYDIDEDTLNNDLKEFVDELIQNKMLVWRNNNKNEQ